MKNKILIAILLFVIGLNLSEIIPARAVDTKEPPAVTKSEVKPSEIQQSEIINVNPLSLIKNPSAYLNKRIRITGTFDKFSILGLDYKPAMKSSDKYITFLIQRPEVENDIPLSELKNFLKRDVAEKYIDLNNGDTIQYTGVVFSNALGDAWVDVEEFTVLKKKEVKK